MLLYHANIAKMDTNTNFIDYTDNSTDTIIQLILSLNKKIARNLIIIQCTTIEKSSINMLKKTLNTEDFTASTHTQQGLSESQLSTYTNVILIPRYTMQN